jgi:HD-GYP domain-containing protein (c-di-GMP phosphodiesterase class II)
MVNEIGEHYNLKRMLGTQGYLDLQRQIANRARIVGSPEAKVWARTAEYYPNLEVGSENFISEVIAKLGETNPELPWYKRLISQIKAFLVKHGLARGFITGTMTGEDMHALLVSSLQSAIRGRTLNEARLYNGETAQASLATARARGYKGNDEAGAVEYLRAKEKGLDLSQTAVKQRLNEMGFDTEERFYHGTSADIHEFKPGITFVSPSAKVAGEMGGRPNIANSSKDSAHQNVLPVYIKKGKNFDYTKPADRKALLDNIFENGNPQATRSALEVNLADRQSNWHTMESPTVQRALKSLGYDSFYTSEYGTKNLAVFNPNQIRSVFSVPDPDFADNSNILASYFAPDTIKPDYKGEYFHGDNDKNKIVFGTGKSEIVKNPTRARAYKMAQEDRYGDIRGIYDNSTGNLYISQASSTLHDWIIQNTGLPTNKSPSNYDLLIIPDGSIYSYPRNIFSDDKPNNDTRFSFAGKEAETADKNQLYNALIRLKKGEDAEVVREETGWHQAKDGKMRFEISDDEAQLTGQQDKITTLGEAITHDKLFAAYPFLKGIPVKFVSEEKMQGANGLLRIDKADTPVIHINEQLQGEERLSTILHESQHAIQAYEGFSTSYNPMSYLKSWDKKHDLLKSKADAAQRFLEAAVGTPDYEAVLKQHHAIIKQLNAMGNRYTAENEAFLKYKRNLAEVEARDTQNRLRMTDADRKYVSPEVTRWPQVAEKDIIVTWNGREAPELPLPNSLLMSEEKAAYYKAQGDIIHTALRALAKKDPETASHVSRVAAIATELSRKLGLNREDETKVHLAALAHDFGKDGMREILEKTGKLTEEEFKILKTHPAQTKVIMEELGLDKEITQIASEHHMTQKAGGGYPAHEGLPHRLSGILQISDIADSLVGGPNSGHNYPLRFQGQELERTAKNIMTIMDDMAAKGETSSKIHDVYKAMFEAGEIPKLQIGLLEKAGEVPWVRGKTREIDLRQKTEAAETKTQLPAANEAMFSFAGEKARTANTFNLSSAQERLDAGERAETVRQETGWHKGADGKMRFEISDKDAELIGYRPLNKQVHLAEVLDHGKLFAAYPDMKLMPVIFKQDMKGARGRLLSNTDGLPVIAIDSDLAYDETISVLMHEVQHAIQAYEGFQAGGSEAGIRSSDFSESHKKEIAELGDKAQQALIDGDSTRAHTLDTLRAQKYTIAQHEAYKRLAGEVEARNTQSRLKMSDYDRKSISPESTQDVKTKDIIVSFNGKDALDMPTPANIDEENHEQAVKQFDNLKRNLKELEETGDLGDNIEDPNEARFSIPDSIRGVFASAEEHDAFRNAVEYIDKQTDTVKDNVYALATQRQLADMARKALTDMPKYIADRTQMDKAVESVVQASDKIAKKWEHLVPHSEIPFADKTRKASNKAAQKALANTFHYATIYDQDPRVPYAGNKKNVQERANYTYVKSLYDKLNDTAKEVFTEVLEDNRNHLERIIAGEKTQIEASTASRKSKDELIKELDLIVEEFGKHTYFPLSRFGGYATYVRINGENFFNMHESEGEMNRFLKRMEKTSGYEKTMGAGKTPEIVRSTNGVSPGFFTKMNDLINGITDDMNDRLKGVTDKGERGRIEKAAQAQKERIKDGMAELYLKTLPDMSARKHFIHRNKTLGFAEDALRGFASKAFHDAKLVGKLEYADKLQSYISSMSKAIEAARRDEEMDRLNKAIELNQGMLDPKGLPEGLEKDLAKLKEEYQLREPDKKAQGDLLESTLSNLENIKSMADKVGREGVTKYRRILNELELSHADLMNPQTSQFASMLNSIGFTYFLGFSPSSALVNGFQVFGMAAPFLQSRFGFVKANAAIARSYKMYFSDPNGDGEGHFSMLKYLQGEARKPGDAGSRARLRLNAFEEAEARGIFSKTQSMDLIGLAEEGVQLGSTRRKLMYAASYMFNRVETQNRQVAFMASFDLEYAKTHDYEGALAYADEVVNTSQGDYMGANKARIMRGPVGRTIFQFKQYAFFTLYNFAKAGLEAIGVAKKKAAGVPLTAEDKQAVKLLGYMVTMQGALAGVLGLPIGGALVIAQVIASMTGDPDDPDVNVEDEFRALLYAYLPDTFGINDMIVRGPLTTLTGIDFQGRTSQANMLFRPPEKPLEGKYGTQYLAETIGGPIGGIAQNVFDFFKMWGDDYRYRAVERVLPKAFKDPLAALRMLREGGATNLRGDVISEINEFSAIAKVIGLTDADTSLVYSINFAKQRVESELKTRRAHLMDLGARDKIKDGAISDEVGEQIAHWNAAQPLNRILPVQILRSVKQRKIASKKMTDGFAVDKKWAHATDKFNYDSSEE